MKTPSPCPLLFFVSAGVLVVACAETDRREFGDQYEIGPDTLANVGADDDEGDDDEGDDGADDGAIDGGVDDGVDDDGGDDAADDSSVDQGTDDGGGGDTGDGGDPVGDTGGNALPPDSPYQGGWDIGTCQDQITGNGTDVGNIMYDFTLKDVYGDEVRLYDFCHKAVWLVSGAFWCGPCNDEAGDLEGEYQQYVDEGLIIISTYGENSSSGAPTQSDLQGWVGEYGMTFPVLSDPGWMVGDMIGDGYIPANMLIAPGMQIAKRGLPSASEIEAVLPN